MFMQYLQYLLMDFPKLLSLVHLGTEMNFYYILGSKGQGQGHIVEVVASSTRRCH